MIAGGIHRAPRPAPWCSYPVDQSSQSVGYVEAFSSLANAATPRAEGEPGKSYGLPPQSAHEGVLCRSLFTCAFEYKAERSCCPPRRGTCEA